MHETFDAGSARTKSDALGFRDFRHDLLAETKQSLDGYLYYPQCFIPNVLIARRLITGEDRKGASLYYDQRLIRY